MSTWYRTGKISLTHGLKAIVGIGTDFVQNVSPGFALLAPDGLLYEVDTITGAGAATLVDAYQGINAANADYAIIQTTGFVQQLSVAVTNMMEGYNGVLLAYENGDLVGKGLALKGILTSEADLPATPAAGDAYLIGTRLYVYTGVSGWKNSNIAGVIPRGPWVAGTAYVVNDLAGYGGAQYRRVAAGTAATAPDVDAANWELFIARGEIGPRGVTPRGSWGAGTEYVLNDTATFKGSQYRRIVPGTTPTSPETDTVNWEMFVSKGLDGAGSVVKVNNISPDEAGNVSLNADNIPETTGTPTNQYFTAARVRSVLLTGMDLATATAIAATDSALAAFGKLQVQVSLLFGRTGGSGGLMFRNKLINANFMVNQLVVSGTVTLTAGQYGHDGWKAGASGCTYTFVTTGTNTVMTVSAGSLLQIVEGRYINGGIYTASTRGTAQMRVAISGAALAGSFSAGPITTAAATSGASVQVEFSTGTIDRPQLEEGAIPSVYTSVPEFELQRCQRYFWKTYAQIHAPGTSTNTGGILRYPEATTSYASFQVRFPVQMAAAPTVVLYSALSGITGVIYNADAPANLTAATASIGENGCTPYVNGQSVPQSQTLILQMTASARL